jgi:hypothetical protein
MIKILLDTNTLHENWLAEGEAFTFIGELIALGACEAFISEIAILEHVRHYQERAPQVETEFKLILGSYSKLSTTPKKLVNLSLALCSAKTFEERFRSRLQELGIQTLNIPAVPHVVLVTRDLFEKKPFSSTGKGYRDALAWLGFLSVLDTSTSKAIVVTNDANDYCGNDKTKLHPDFRIEINDKNPACEDRRFASPQKLADELIKPLLKSLADDAKKTKRILKKIQENKYKSFKLEDVVMEGLENFESGEAEGTFYGGSVPLEEPIWVTIIEDPTEIEAVELYKLSNGHYLCEGIALVSATVEGFLDKFEAFNQSEQGHVFVSTANWNEHYSEVEVTNVPAQITFSFEFEDDDPEILKFEVTKVESNN